MRVVGTDTINAYAKRKPKKKACLLAFRALMETARWRQLTDVEAQFSRVAIITPPDRIAFDFPDEDMRIEGRLNCAMGLLRVTSIGPSSPKHRTEQGDKHE